MFKTPRGIAIIIGFSVLSLSVTYAVYLKFKPHPVVTAAALAQPQLPTITFAATSEGESPTEVLTARLPARHVKSSEMAPLDADSSVPRGNEIDADESPAENRPKRKAAPRQLEPAPADDGDIFQAARDSVKHQTYQASAIAGGAFAKDNFADISSDGILIGLRIGLGKFLNYDIVQFIEPIYLTPTGEQYGEGHGKGIARIIDLKAPAGYAVGGITVKGGGGTDSVYLDYMRIRGSRLDPSDIRSSERVGGPGGGFDVHFNGNGTPIVGIVGRMNKPGEYLGLGAVFLEQPVPSKRRR